METHPKKSRPGKLRRLTPYAISFVAGIVAVAAMLGGYAWENKFVGKTALEFFARTLGYDYFMVKRSSIMDALRAAPANYLRDVDTPKVVIDIKFEHWRKILEKRAQAMAKGVLIQEAGDFVPASIRYSDGKSNAVVKVKLRLKGDWLDHLNGDKWSFRVRARNKDQFFGMRRFSLQRPETRDFQLTPMILSLTESLGIVSPRYFFVDVTINGNHIGIMAVEEHPAKELLEASARKESVIIRFSEEHYWNSVRTNTEGTGSFTPFDDYRFAPIDSFQTARIAKSPVLTRNHRVAAGLLRGFADGRLPASEVFDTELMARFLAVAELFGAWHGIRWHNLRFYFNPQTTRLEPVPFDLTSNIKWGSYVTKGEPIVRAMLSDPKIGRAFRASLEKLIADIQSGDLVKRLAKVESRHLPSLQKEYVLHGKFPLDRLPKRASMLKRMIFDSGGAAPIRYDQLLFARDHTEGRKRILTLLNALTAPVTVTRVYLAACTGAAPDSVEAVAGDRLPLTLPAAKPGQRPAGIRVELIDGLDRNCTVRVDSRVAGTTKNRTISVDPDALALGASPIPESTIPEQLAGRDFLAHDRDGRVLRVAAGDHLVRRDIIVPDDTTLMIAAGTTLRFAPGAAIVAHGPVRFMGTADAPIILRPADDAKGWPGIAVLRAGAKSRLQHTRIVDTTGVVKPGWSLTGGVTFYESDVEIVSVTFIGHRGEDALNIVRSNFVIDDTTFDTTLSDAFDSDFSTGRISGSSFVNIGTAGGGDAIDTSGSEVEITGATFRKISDKAISVGEASTVGVVDVTIDDAGTGLASKDRSTLTASRVVIRNAKFAALTAYIKKPEYGGATIIADDITIEGENRRTLVQTGSRIVLAGREIETQDIDVGALYDTVMKPGAR